jgi:hypothetical protein
MLPSEGRGVNDQFLRQGARLGIAIHHYVCVPKMNADFTNTRHPVIRAGHFQAGGAQAYQVARSAQL